MSRSTNAHALEVAVGAFIDELVRAGIRHVCACPGSRSTPLALMCARAHADGRLRLWMHVDERSAGFFALGLARARREPVALLATSGTAAANFLPAVIEAHLSRVPLIVLTADRPHELRDVGAPQTIDQVRLYGVHAKWFVDLPEPELTTEHVRLIRTTAGRAVGTALTEPAGPVHVNWPFREPLVPGLLATPETDSLAPTPTWGARPGGRPYVHVEAAPRQITSEVLERLAEVCADARTGLIVCGPHDDPRLPSAAVDLARATGWPLLADALAGIRRGQHDHTLVIDAYDAFLRDATTIDRLGGPDVVLRIGSMPTSKPLLQYLERWPSARHVLVDTGGWRDPTGLASEMVYADPTTVCTALAGCLDGGTRADTRWTDAWVETNRVAARVVADHLDALGEASEAGVMRQVVTALPPGSTLVVGNSMPVRDLDTVLANGDGALRTLANRGANGIDGVVSTAFGTSAGTTGPTVLVIGDLSFYHDMNGLLAARAHALDLVVVLVNNDGGGIFSFLSQAEAASANASFETVFGTPTGLDFRPFVEGYGGTFARVADPASFADAFAAALQGRGLRVLEVCTRRDANVAQHRALWRAVSEALAGSAVGAAT